MTLWREQVFVNARKSCDVVYRQVHSKGFKATVLHGGKTQDGREAALAEFKEGIHDIIVCTDVAGRGIDVSGVEHVINYDCPKNIEDYTHRIGRTGRAGKTGIFVSLITRHILPPSLPSHLRAAVGCSRNAANAVCLGSGGWKTGVREGEGEGERDDDTVALGERTSMHTFYICFYTALIPQQSILEGGRIT